jgi:hypothetical protein
LAKDDGCICTRDCTQHREPRICYYKFFVEQYSAMGPWVYLNLNSIFPRMTLEIIALELLLVLIYRACRNCSGGKTSDCYQQQCVTGDGIERTAYTINRMMPGPTINVNRWNYDSIFFLFLLLIVYFTKCVRRYVTEIESSLTSWTWCRVSRLRSTGTECCNKNHLGWTAQRSFRNVRFRQMGNFDTTFWPKRMALYGTIPIQVWRMVHTCAYCRSSFAIALNNLMRYRQFATWQFERRSHRQNTQGNESLSRCLRSRFTLSHHKRGRLESLPVRHVFPGLLPEWNVHSHSSWWLSD